MRGLLCFAKSVAVAACAAACLCFAWALTSSPVFERGTSYELYLGTSSSCAIVPSQNPAFDKLFLPAAAGESVRYEGDRAQEIAEKFGAKLLFTEEACGVVNYYLYSPALKDGILLRGEEVNLHIAVGNGQTAAGTPLIFGGF